MNIFAKGRWLLAWCALSPWMSAVAVTEGRTVLRVCAPPFNLPMSDKDLSGYENKIAELFGSKLGIPVQYEWFPQRIGFIRNTLRNNETPDGAYKCDIVMGVIENFELAATSVPYMHAAWAMVYVKGRGLDFIREPKDLAALTEEQKATLRIGVWDRGPAADWVFRLGLMEHATPYPIMSGDARESPGRIIERDLVEDKINLTFVWGPIAGYYAKTIKDPEIVVIPLRSEPGVQFDFRISMAVRYGEKAWKDEVNRFIHENQTQIDGILADYGVPLLELSEHGGGDVDDDD